MPAISPNSLRQRMEADPRLLVVDVRDPDLFHRGTIPGAVNVPYEQGVAAVLARQVADRRRPVVVVCGWGHRSAIARIAIAREGFRDVAYLEGGLESWGLHGLPIERGAIGRHLSEDVDQRARAAGDSP